MNKIKILFIILFIFSLKIFSFTLSIDTGSEVTGIFEFYSTYPDLYDVFVYFDTNVADAKEDVLNGYTYGNFVISESGDGDNTDIIDLRNLSNGIESGTHTLIILAYPFFESEEDTAITIFYNPTLNILSSGWSDSSSFTLEEIVNQSSWSEVSSFTLNDTSLPPITPPAKQINKQTLFLYNKVIRPRRKIRR